MALPQPATTDDVITLGQLLDESFVQNTDKLNVQLMENLSALKTNNDLSKTVAESITKQQQTSERMAQAQERQADTAALAETESAREEARFKGDESFVEKLADTLIPSLAGIRKQLEEQQELAEEQANKGGIGNLFAGAGKAKLIGLVLPLLTGLVPLLVPLIIGGAAVGAVGFAFKKVFGDGGIADQAEQAEAAKDANLDAGREMDSKMQENAEKILAKIEEAKAAGNEEETVRLSGLLDELVEQQKEKLKQVNDVAGFFRDKTEREAVSSARGTLRSLQKLQEQAGESAEPSAEPVATATSEMETEGVAEAVEPETPVAPVEGTAEPVAEPEAAVEPVAVAEPVSEPAASPNELPSGITQNPDSGKFEAYYTDVKSDGSTGGMSSMHDTLEEAIAAKNEAEERVKAHQEAAAEKRSNVLKDRLAAKQAQAEANKQKEIEQLQADYAELQELEAAIARGEDVGVTTADLEEGRADLMAEAETLGVDLEGGSVEVASAGTGERMGAMSEEAASGSGQPIIINNVKQGDTVTQTQINSGGGGAKDARPNAGSQQLG